MYFVFYSHVSQTHVLFASAGPQQSRRGLASANSLVVGRVTKRVCVGLYSTVLLSSINSSAAVCCSQLDSIGVRIDTSVAHY